MNPILRARLWLALSIVLVIGGFVVLLAGVTAQFGWEWAAIVGGAIALAAGLWVVPTP